MIDMHIHVVPPNLPGVGPLRSILKGPTDPIAQQLTHEMNEAGFTHAFAMGAYGMGDSDPLGIARTLEIARSVPGLYAIGIADPRRSDQDSLRLVEPVLASGKVIALKAYLGYIHAYPNDDGYRPYYRLAEKYHLPFIFHCGDTYSPYAKLKYAHPLGVDEVAVDHPLVNFVIAHVGNPWMQDAAEVVYKNVNVWCDVSGLIVGETDDDFEAPEPRAAIQEVSQRLAQAFRYAERPNRFLYGSDWPLAPMMQYRDFILRSLPEDYHELILRENARKLFRLDR